MAPSIIVDVFMWIFLYHIVAQEPNLQQNSSIIGTNPALGLRPMPSDHGSVIRYKGNDPESYKVWVKELSDYLTDYKFDGKANAESIVCTFEFPPPPGKACFVDNREWGPCGVDNHFGYQTSTPCIFLKLNEIFGWKPEFYNSTDNLPQAMPNDLKDHIRYTAVHGKNHLNMVWVSCQGETPADTENIGPIQYLPNRGFPGYYFPYTNQKGYLSPLVAVHLERPKTGVLINIECRAWANNIKYDRLEGMGRCM